MNEYDVVVLCCDGNTEYLITKNGEAFLVCTGSERDAWKIVELLRKDSTNTERKENDQY